MRNKSVWERACGLTRTVVEGVDFDEVAKVASAITGTKWNGPRFFGLRDKSDRSTVEAQS